MVDGGIKGRVEVIQQIYDLEGCGVGRDGGEAHDVREVDGDLLKFLWGDGHPQLKLISHRAGRKEYRTNSKMEDYNDVMGRKTSKYIGIIQSLMYVSCL